MLAHNFDGFARQEKRETGAATEAGEDGRNRAGFRIAGWVVVNCEGRSRLQLHTQLRSLGSGLAQDQLNKFCAYERHVAGQKEDGISFCCFQGSVDAAERAAFGDAVPADDADG